MNEKIKISEISRSAKKQKQQKFEVLKMSEVRNEKPMTGNLRNRIDNNLKLEIPKVNDNLVLSKPLPATAPARDGMKDQFGDIPLLKGLITNWGGESMKEFNTEDYFKKTPPSSSGIKREKKRSRTVLSINAF